MAKPEWGTKRTCPNCNVHFYDLRHNPIVCPKCNSIVELEVLIKNQQRLALEKRVIKTNRTITENRDEEGEDILSEIDEENEIKSEEEDLKREEESGDNLIEDASDLGVDDNDDMAEVIAHLEDEHDL